MRQPSCSHPVSIERAGKRSTGRAPAIPFTWRSWPGPSDRALGPDCQVRGALEEGSIPMAVRSALAEELRQLSGPARALLEGASVAGDPCEVGTAPSAGGMDIDD